MWMHGFGGGPFGYLGMGIGMLMHVLVLAVLVLFAVWLFRSLKGGSVTKHEEAPVNALEVLKLRLAKGEITLEEYRERKEELEKV
ncbi:SHOCT domain-containing protein [Anaeromusa acidaminophila]|uniref:SHOCT domain-containing protein n=1 Tax=Anaeromusa acidaminophila TaxID=81464 RepID=UPI00036124D7|nr:SHOCT domain-containing protein [Anaeromusa acidaminophila]